MKVCHDNGGDNNSSRMYGKRNQPTSCLIMYSANRVHGALLRQDNFQTNLGKSVAVGFIDKNVGAPTIP